MYWIQTNPDISQTDFIDKNKHFTENNISKIFIDGLPYFIQD